jgi:hypothetical protein
LATATSEGAAGSSTNGPPEPLVVSPRDKISRAKLNR